MVVQSFHDLILWQKAHGLTLNIYEVTKKFPTEERFGLSSQLRRAAVSVAANIVEGHQKNSQRDFLNFLNIARGSLEETKYLLFLSKDLGYLDDKDFQRLTDQADEVGKVLYGFQQGLKNRSVRSSERLTLNAER